MRLFARLPRIYIESMSERSPLHEWHASHGAKFTDFAGWEMPLSYKSGALAEHRLVRGSAGIFDVSHMAEFQIAGTDATAVLEQIVTASVGTVNAGSSTYALLCQPDGGVIDDLYLYRLADRWFVVANAANRVSDAQWLQEQIDAIGGDVTFTDVSDETAMFALQGPRAIAVADAITQGDASGITRFGIAASGDVLIGRTGYTGEDGVELFVTPERALELWESAFAAANELEVELGAIGLAARDSLRFEPGFALYGHELRRDITPLEARLGWACDLDTAFVGRDALVQQKAQGLAKRLATVRMTERGVPRDGQRVLKDGEPVGEVVSGMYAPTLDGFYANVYIPPGLAKTETDVEIDIRGQGKAARVVKRPLYTPSYR